ncbi:MAG TPA: type II toxin-antitoxin system VapC family toxin [Aurantimonas sp.]|jgi:ribonuclease VapC|nr:type II toxin-antitoxin system VapC family toxin [Aurantimonas sp.]
MFVDASVLCALMAREPDFDALSSRLEAATDRITSPMAVWEAAISLARIMNIGPEAALEGVRQLLSKAEIAVVPIPPEAGALAVEAYARFGKGRHKAALNFGDCFAYACARHYGVKLLYKGDDFALTDIEPA